MPGTSDFCWYS